MSGESLADVLTGSSYSHHQTVVFFSFGLMWLLASLASIGCDSALALRILEGVALGSVSKSESENTMQVGGVGLLFVLSSVQ